MSETRNDGFPGSGFLLSVLAHDLNNVLGGVTGALSLIEFEKEDSPELHNPAYDSYLEIIQKSSIRATGIVQQLLVLTRQPGNRSKTISMAESLERLTSSVKAASGTGIVIGTDPVPREARIPGDAIRFEKLILLILLTAGAGPNPQGSTGEVVLSVSPDEKPSGDLVWRLSIRGAGCDSRMLKELTDWYGPELDTRIPSAGELELDFPAVSESV